jgi:hypothetical protein
VEAVPRLGLAGDQRAQACVAELEDKGLVQKGKLGVPRFVVLGVCGYSIRKAPTREASCFFSLFHI